MLPRKGSRAITVGENRYRWRLRRRPTALQRHGAPLTVAIALADGRGQLLLVDTHGLHPHNQAQRYGVSVQPRHVSAWIRQALADGWRPSQPGKPFVLRYPRAGLPRVYPPHQPPIEPGSPVLAERPRDHIVRQGWQVAINGRLFMELLREAEQPHVDRENAARSDGSLLEAGDYYPSVSLLQHPSDDDHGFVLDADDCRRRKSVLLGCSCGITECWMLMADTWTVDDVVVWANFEQFHRDWIYDLGPFVFERAVFEAL